MIDRRQMLILSALGAFSLTGKNFFGDGQPTKQVAPRVDYHVHIGDGITVNDAIAVSKRRGVKFGLLQHAGAKGHGYAISSDDELIAWLNSLAGKPVFKGIEAEGTDWKAAFSKSVLARVDYIQSDPLGMPDATGAPMKLWSPEFKCDDPENFMDRYVDFHVQL